MLIPVCKFVLALAKSALVTDTRLLMPSIRTLRALSALMRFTVAALTALLTVVMADCNATLVVLSSALVTLTPPAASIPLTALLTVLI